MGSVPRRLVAIRLLVFTFALMLAGPASASASPVTLTFDDKADGVPISDDYAGSGAVFGEGFIGPDGQVPTIYTPSDPGAPHSAPRTLSFSHCTTTEVQQSCANDLWIHFSKFQTVVSFYAGLREGVGAFSGSVPLTVALYRSDQTQIGSGSTQDVGRGTQTKVSVDQHDYLPPCLVENPGCNDAPTIAFVHITAPDTAHAHDGLALDDFTLDDGGSTAPPDFGIGRVDATSPLNLPGGASRQATFQIGRFGGSSGGIDLSVLGLPTNVSASFTPELLYRRQWRNGHHDLKCRRQRPAVLGQHHRGRDSVGRLCGSWPALDLGAAARAGGLRP